MKKTKASKQLYGKFHQDTYEFHKEIYELFSDFISRNIRYDTKYNYIEINNEVVELRNRVVALLDSWIGTKKLETKFGVKIPLSNTPTSVESFLEKQSRSYNKNFIPCEVCNENRVTHFCHIIPRSVGGTNDQSNYLFLCPTHHHLFDHHRLSKDEWNKIDLSKKSESSKEYIKKVTLPILEKFWIKR